MPKRIIAGSVATLLTMALPAAAGDPCAEPEHEDYSSHACKVARLRARSFVVVAAVDSGINPYHVDFRLSEDDDRLGVHPSEYIEGFPASAPTLDLTLEASSPAQGRFRDAAAWSRVEPATPYWVAGTNVVGAVGPGTGGDFFDTDGHGTGVASLLGGLRYGRGTTDVLVVAVRDWSDGFRWAAKQPWIDVISISWTETTPLEDGSVEASRDAAAGGKITCAASGNLSVPLVALEAHGPSAPVHVGAVDPGTGQMKTYSGWPNDVLGLTDQRAASHASITGTQTFTGTSAAAPHVCALLAKGVAGARSTVGDVREGPHGGGLVAGPPRSGALADGVITRVEVEDAVQATAVPRTTQPGAFVREGYGLVDALTLDQAMRVLFGEAPRPERPQEDAWQGAMDAARDAVWDHVPDCPDC